MESSPYQGVVGYIDGGDTLPIRAASKNIGII